MFDCQTYYQTHKQKWTPLDFIGLFIVYGNVVRLESPT